MPLASKARCHLGRGVSASRYSSIVVIPLAVSTGRPLASPTYAHELRRTSTEKVRFLASRSCLGHHTNVLQAAQTIDQSKSSIESSPLWFNPSHPSRQATDICCWRFPEPLDPPPLSCVCLLHLRSRRRSLACRRRRPARCHSSHVVSAAAALWLSQQRTRSNLQWCRPTTAEPSPTDRARLRPTAAVYDVRSTATAAAIRNGFLPRPFPTRSWHHADTWARSRRHDAAESSRYDAISHGTEWSE